MGCGASKDDKKKNEQQQQKEEKKAEEKPKQQEPEAKKEEPAKKEEDTPPPAAAAAAPPPPPAEKIDPVSVTLTLRECAWSTEANGGRAKAIVKGASGAELYVTPNDADEMCDNGEETNEVVIEWEDAETKFRLDPSDEAFVTIELHVGDEKRGEIRLPSAEIAKGTFNYLGPRTWKLRTYADDNAHGLDGGEPVNPAATIDTTIAVKGHPFPFDRVNPQEFATFNDPEREEYRCFEPVEVDEAIEGAKPAKVVMIAQSEWAMGDLVRFVREGCGNAVELNIAHPECEDDPEVLLAAIAELPNLQYLGLPSFEGTGVHDGNVAKLAPVLPKLTRLDLSGNPNLSGAAVGTLQLATSVKYLSLMGTGVDLNGVLALCKAMPELKFLNPPSKADPNGEDDEQVSVIGSPEDLQKIFAAAPGIIEIDLEHVDVEEVAVEEKLKEHVPQSAKGTEPFMEWFPEVAAANQPQ